MPAHPAGSRYADLIALPGTPPLPADPAEMHRIAAPVWPRTATRGPDGALRLGEVDVRDAVERHGSPVTLLDREHFRSAAEDFVAAYDHDRLPGTVYYAGKAFLAGAVARWVDEAGLSLDVASAGELELALRAGFPPGRIGFHGNNKSVAEIDRALQVGVGRIVLDSFEEIARVAAVAEQLGLIADVLVRVTVGVEAHTHEFIATAHEDQKFGFSITSGDCRRCGCGACTPTSARRSSTLPGSNSPPTG